MAEETRTLVIAFGNPLREDDGVGFETAMRLENSAEEKNLEVIFRQQLTPDLAAPIAAASRVIFIDADTGPVPGRISVQRLRLEERHSSLFYHRMSPSELLSWSKALYGRAPEAAQITVSGTSFDFREGLTPPVTAALPVLIQLVEQLSDGTSL